MHVVTRCVGTFICYIRRKPRPILDLERRDAYISTDRVRSVNMPGFITEHRASPSKESLDSGNGSVCTASTRYPSLMRGQEKPSSISVPKEISTVGV